MWIYSNWLIILLGLVTTPLKVASQRPVITQQPADGYAQAGGPFTFHIRTEKNEADPASHIWFKNGVRVETQYDNPSSLISLLTEGSLFFLQFKSEDAGTYMCRVTNSAGSVTSQNATVQLAELTAEFRTKPQSTNAVLGRVVRLQCQPPRGTPEPKVRWKKDRMLLSINNNRRLSLESGTLVINNVQKSDEGNYVCVGINEAGEIDSDPALLRVLEAPNIHGPPIEAIANQGDTASFKCNATGDPTPSIRWIKNDDLIDLSRTIVNAEHTLIINHVDSTDEGSYTCIAINEGGESRAVAHLTVYTPPVFLESPTSKTVGVGSNITFRCVVDGNPHPVIYWQSSGTDENIIMYQRQNVGRFSVQEDGTLRITSIRDGDEGQYECTAVNSAGRNSTSVSLRVKERADSRPPPVITTKPSNVTVSLTQAAELQCQASGNPSPTIRWTHNGRPVPVTPRISINRGNLKITDIMVTDFGLYTCLAISESGDASASAFLTVVGARNSAVKTLLPSAPEKPVASEQDTTRTSVKLHWVPNVDNGDDIFYSVEYFTRNSKEGWVVAVYSTRNTWAEITGLLSGASYVMLVRAHNKYGTSEPSKISEYIKTKGANDLALGWTNGQIRQNLGEAKVELNSADVLSSTAINVTWLVEDESRQYIEGYYVRVASNQVLTEVVHGSLSNYHIVTQLQPFMEYRVTVTPFYHTFSGRPSGIRLARTQEDVPSGPPSEVIVSEGSRYITVSWTPVKPSHRNGEIIEYVIVCNGPDLQSSRNFTVNATVTKVALENLNRDTSYKIGVAAKTKAGVGIISHMTQIMAIETDEGGEPAWLKPTIIGGLGGVLWVILCVLIICLYRRRKALRKAKKQAANNSLVTVPLQSATSPTPLFVQYQIDHPNNYQHHTMSELPMEMPPSYNGHYPHNYTEYPENYNDLKDPGPYATTVILNNMPDRDESLIPRESPHATMNGHNLRGSIDSSCTDNNAGRGGQSSSSGDAHADSRASPPVLPSFAEMLPPPPQYPPPPNYDRGRTPGTPSAQTLGVPSRGPHSHCHTCHRGYNMAPHYQQRVDTLQRRTHNPTMPHIHSQPQCQQYASNHDYQTTFPRENSHPYQTYMCSSHGSDSHDYAEPHFEGQDNGIYGGVPPIAHQRIPPPHLLHQVDRRPLLHQNSSPGVMAHHHQHHPVDPRIAERQPMLPQSLLPQALQQRNHSLPSSEHSHDLCQSCAEHTEYDEPWTDQQWPMMWEPNELERFRAEQEAAQNGEHEVASSMEERSQCSHGTGQSRSGSEDSKSGRQKQKRRQRAAQLAPRPSSPYNGYSTDSSVCFVPRKPYPKSQRKKQMNNKNKNTKSLAVQVEQEEMSHDSPLHDSTRSGTPQQEGQSQQEQPLLQQDPRQDRV